MARTRSPTPGAIALLQLARKDDKAALGSFENGLAIFEARLGKNHLDVSYALVGIGTTLTNLERAREAVAPLDRALQIRAAAGSPINKLIAETRYSLAWALAADPHTRARAVREGTTALAGYEKAGGTANIAKVKHRLANPQAR